VDQIHHPFEIRLISLGDHFIAGIAFSLHPDDAGRRESIRLLVTIDILNCKRVAHCGEKMIVLIDVAIFAIDMEVWFPATHK
jgi:hypothetical protein